MRHLVWLSGVLLALSCSVDNSNLNVDAGGTGGVVIGSGGAGGCPRCAPTGGTGGGATGHRRQRDRNGWRDWRPERRRWKRSRRWGHPGPAAT